MLLTETDITRSLHRQRTQRLVESTGMSTASIATLAVGTYGLAGLGFYALLRMPIPIWFLILMAAALFVFPSILLFLLTRTRRPQPVDRSADLLEVLTRSWDAVSVPHALFGPGDRLIYANQAFVDLAGRLAGGASGSAADLLRTHTDALAPVLDAVSQAHGEGSGLADLPADPGGLSDSDEAAEGAVTGGQLKATQVDGGEGYVAVELLPAAPEAPDATETAPAPAPASLTPDAEGALREAERRALKIFEEAPFGIAMLTQRGELNFCNQAFQQMMGQSQGQMQSRPVTSLVTEETRQNLDDRLRGIMAGEQFETPVDIAPGAEPQTAISVYATVVGRGSGDGIIILHCLDNTAQRNLELQFTQSQKMQAIGQLAGGIAHDFNNLLTAMIGFCDLLLLRHRPGEQNYADITQIKQNANRAADLVRQLLAFSRQQTLKPKVLSVTEVMSDISQLLRRLVGPNVELNVKHDRGLGRVMADQGQLEQVIINLVVNARDAMTDGGTVNVSTRNLATDMNMQLGADILPPGEWTVIDVADSGVGIPAENLDRIFEPFFSTKEVGSGTGLGLSTVYGIVKQCDGYIAVESVVGEGTTFSIYLPQHSAAVTAAERAPATDAPRDLTGAGAILLVEDEEPVRLFASRALANKGYTMVEAASGHAALEVIDQRAEPFDLIITDIMMPQMDGASLVKHIRDKWPDVGIVCISGYAEDEFRQKLNDLGDVHFLSKPFSLNQLAGMVKDVLAQRRTPEFSGRPADANGALPENVGGSIPHDSDEGRKASVFPMS